MLHTNVSRDRVWRDGETLCRLQKRKCWRRNRNDGRPFETDGAMPKNVWPLRVRCQEVMGRVSPTVSPHPSDDEASV
jgi:hypothetical protein